MDVSTPPRPTAAAAASAAASGLFTSSGWYLPLHAAAVPRRSTTRRSDRRRRIRTSGGGGSASLSGTAGPPPPPVPSTTRHCHRRRCRRRLQLRGDMLIPTPSPPSAPSPASRFPGPTAAGVAAAVVLCSSTPGQTPATLGDCCKGAGKSTAASVCGVNPLRFAREDRRYVAAAAVLARWP